MDIKVPWHDWSIVRKIGSGSFGNVYEIHRDVFGMVEKAALKVISIPHNADEIDEFRAQGQTELEITKYYQQCLQEIVREYAIMSQIRGHANIVYCDDVQYVSHDDGIGWDIYIKMELLHPLMKSLDKVTTEAQVAKLGRDISEALVRCKEENIIHRDIKPQNIFVSDKGDFKLGDFGIAKTVERTTGGTRIGTYKYMAPEVYNNHPYGATSDVYSLGLVLYWLLNEKRTPFLPPAPQIATASHEEQAGLRRFRGEAIPAPKYGSDELKRIVLKACAYASVDRYASAAELLTDLKAMENVSTVPFALISVPDPMEKVDTGTDVLDYGDARETVLLGNAQETMLLNEQETMLLNQQETMLLDEQKQKKKKKTALWITIGAAVVGIVILLLMLKSCDGVSVDDGKADTITVPTVGNGITATNPGNSITTPITSDTTTVPTLSPEIVQTAIVLDYGYTSLADGQASYNTYGVNLKEEIAEQGNTITLPTPSRPGYSFDGWYTAQTGGEKLNSSIVADQSTTIYARWIGKMVNVTYSANGGTFPNGKATVVVSIQNGSTFVLPQEMPTREGYNFMGWSDGESSVTNATIKSNVNSQIVQAVWGDADKASYQVNCVAVYQDGTKKLIKEYAVINKLNATYTITPEEMTGYQAPKAQSVKWDSAVPKTITFEYTPNKVNGTVYYKYGTTTEQTVVSYEYNSNPQIIAKSIVGYTPNNQSQTIAEWGTGGTSVIFTYVANQYTVIFNANGGSGTMNNQVLAYDKVQSLHANTFSKPANSVFLGWSTTASDKQPKYEADKSYTFNLTPQNGESVTLYAIWETISLSVGHNVVLYRDPTGLDMTSAATLTLSNQNTDEYSTTGILSARASGYTHPQQQIGAKTNNGSAISYYSSNNSVATVSDGIITVVNAEHGDYATITARSANGAEISCIVTVLYGADGVTWTVENNAVVSALPSGGTHGLKCSVEAVAPGTTTVTARIGGKYPRTFTVTVLEAYKAIAITDTSTFAELTNTEIPGVGLNSFSSKYSTSFSFTFVTGDTTPSGCLYQCIAGGNTGKGGVRIYMDDGRVSVSQNGYSSSSGVTSAAKYQSSYVLAANTKYTVTVTYSKRTEPSSGSAYQTVTIIVKNADGKELDRYTTKSYKMYWAEPYVMSIGANPAIINGIGTAPNIDLIAINLTGVSGNLSPRVFEFSCDDYDIGVREISHGGFLSTWVGTSIQWHYR